MLYIISYTLLYEQTPQSHVGPGVHAFSATIPHTCTLTTHACNRSSTTQAYTCKLLLYKAFLCVNLEPLAGIELTTAILLLFTEAILRVC